MLLTPVRYAGYGLTLAGSAFVFSTHFPGLLRTHFKSAVSSPARDRAPAAPQTDKDSIDQLSQAPQSYNALIVAKPSKRRPRCSGTEVLPPSNLSAPVPPVAPRRKWLPSEDEVLLAEVSKARMEGRRPHWTEVSKKLGRGFSSTYYRAQTLDSKTRKGPWTPEEDAVVCEAIHQLPKNTAISWARLGKQLHRLPHHVKGRWTSILDPSIKRGFWTKEEDAAICREMSLLGRTGLGPNWTKLGLELKRSPNSILGRWAKVLHPHVKWGRFDVLEDRAVMEEMTAAEREGRRINWSAVARTIGRTEAQIQSRWKCTLNPVLRHGKFTPAEDILILRERRNGTSWIEIGTALNRPATTVRNRFVKTLWKHVETGK